MKKNVATSNQPKEEQVHELDKYKEILECYDIHYVKYSNQPSGKLFITDRKTGKDILDGPTFKEEKIKLSKQLVFAKSWIKACGNNLSMSGENNKYGINAKQWEHSFSNDAKSVYDLIIETLKNNTAKSIGTEKFIDAISSKSNYKYAKSICEGLLAPENITYDWQLSNIYETLSKNAGVSASIFKQSINKNI